MTILRPELLRGQAVAVVGDADGSLSAALAALGASVVPGAESATRALVYDARPAFSTGGEEGLRAVLDEAWATVSTVANSALIPAGEPTKIVLVGPHQDARAFADAARAALENLARTLSVEWARYGITTVMLAPGKATTEDELSQLVCFLVSPAGEYVSGCRLELGAV